MRRRCLGTRVDELVVQLPELTVGQVLTGAAVKQARFSLIGFQGLFRSRDPTTHLIDALVQPAAGAAGDFGLRSNLLSKIKIDICIGDFGCLVRIP